jgi:hypothetical protein
LSLLHPPAQSDSRENRLKILECEAGSPYGCCLLGRVIEILGGKNYEDDVKQSVLAPIGIQGLRHGRSRREDRYDEEVRYYDPAIGPSVFAVPVI